MTISGEHDFTIFSSTTEEHAVSVPVALGFEALSMPAEASSLSMSISEVQDFAIF